MNPRRPFLYGFALGIMIATLSSYYHFCKPLQGQSVSEIMLQTNAAPTVTVR
jgi:hypothetical protein